MSKYLSTNRVNEVISSLELTTENLQKVSKDANRWKWIIIATHNALQNIMVEALWLGNGFGAMTDKSVKKWYEEYENNNESSVQLRLANFNDLYKRIKKKKLMCGYVHSRPFKPEQKHTLAVKNINLIRNRFIHFEISVWGLEINGLPDICINCMEILKFLVLESGNIAIWDAIERERLNKSIDNSVNMLMSIREELLATAE